MTVRKETGYDAKSKKLLFKQNITFSLGVTRIEDLPKETSAEVAFFGRSNAVSYTHLTLPTILRV